MAGPVRVLRHVMPLAVRRRVLEQLDVGAVTDTQHRDLVDRGRLRDVDNARDERPCGERAEGERRDRAHHILEPLDRLVDIGNGDTDVVAANEAQLATTDTAKHPARRGLRTSHADHRSGCYRPHRDRALRQELPAPHPRLAHLPPPASRDDVHLLTPRRRCRSRVDAARSRREAGQCVV